MGITEHSSKATEAKIELDLSKVPIFQLPEVFRILHLVHSGSNSYQFQSIYVILYKLILNYLDIDTIVTLKLSGITELAAKAAADNEANSGMIDDDHKVFKSV